jgi:hypothetical protein
MTSPADHAQPAVAARRRRFVLRGAADINHLLVHLVTHRKLPGVDIRVDGLPALDSQRAQDRFVRLAENCNCLLGVMLGAGTLVVGGYAMWISPHPSNLWLLALATLAAALLGKAMELAWTRARLVLVLRKLRHQLAEASAGRIAPVPAKASAARVYPYPLNREDGELPHEDRIPRSHAPFADRPRVPLRDVGDIHRLVLHLFTHWTLPHMRIEAEALPGRIVRRAQDRLVRLSAGYNYLLAAVLALAALLSGLAVVVWPTDELKDELVLWTVHKSANWSGVLLVLLGTLGAALLGWLGEVLWIRLRLLWVLLRLRSRMRSSVTI